MKLTWHKHNNIWSKSIGRALSADKSRLVQKFFYFNANRDKSERMAAQLLAEWRCIKQSWKKAYQPELEMLGEPFADIPHWTTKRTSKTAIKSSLAVAHAIQSAQNEWDELTADATDSELSSMVNPTLAELRFLFLSHQKKRVGVTDGIEIGTYRQMELDLSYAFKAIDENISLSLLTMEKLEAMKNTLLKTKAKRTAVNYMKALKRMLDWSYGREISGDNRPPKGYQDVFQFKRYMTADIRTYTNEQIKQLLGAANEPTRLNILLALNCGMTAVDIGELLLSEVDLKHGHIFWRRSKTENVNNFRTCHKLWKETLHLLKRHILKDGDLNDEQGNPLALKTPNGKPWYWRNEKGDKRDNVARAFEELTADLEIKGLRFKDFRKTTATRLLEVSNENDMPRQFRGEAIPGMSKFYEGRGIKVFDKMNAYLLKIGDEMRKEKVFNSIKV
jgi:integrase